MAGNLPSMFRQLNETIGQSPLADRDNQGVQGMAPSPLDNINPTMRQFVQGAAKATGIPGDYTTSRQKVQQGNDSMGSAMQSQDPVMLMEAASLLFQQGRPNEGAALVQRADEIKAKQDELKLQTQKEEQDVKDLETAINLAITNKDADWVRMLKTGQIKPEYYFQHLRDTSTESATQRIKRENEPKTTGKYQKIGDALYHIPGDGGPPVLAVGKGETSKDWEVWKDEKGRILGSRRLDKKTGDQYFLNTDNEPVNPEKMPNPESEDLTESQRIAKLNENTLALTNIKKIKENLDSGYSTGKGGSPFLNRVWVHYTKGMAFTSAGGAESLLKPLKAKLTLDALIGVKAAGTTLGQITKPEFEMLQSSLFDMDQSSPEFADTLDRYEAMITRFNDFLTSGNEYDLVDWNSKTSGNFLRQIGGSVKATDDGVLWVKLGPGDDYVQTNQQKKKKREE
tara:strand:- start:4368 stop:5729 length:1362 start_codon:yes stop_codon:yes gene_type:complete